MATPQEDTRLFLHKYKPITVDDFKTCYQNCGLDNENMKNNFRVYDMIKTLMQCTEMALLLVGREGTGKTALLHSLVHEYVTHYNYTPENILFLNTLRDQGVQFYRNDVKNFCQTASKFQRKVVIFDDIDFLSEQSQQVFLTCVEKYRHTCHFVITATNIHKLMDGIQSSFMILQLKSLERTELKYLMDLIIATENLSITEEGKAKMLDMSFQTVCNVKIMLSFLEKCKLMRPLDETETVVAIGEKEIEQLCSIISFHHYENYLITLKEGNLRKAIGIVLNLFDEGYSVMDVLDNFFHYIKHLKIDQTNVIDEDDKYVITKLLCKYISYFHILHEDEIELTLLTNNLKVHFETKAAAK